MFNPLSGSTRADRSEDTLALLNNLRAFRHRERNSYATTLDLEIVIERARDAIRAAGHLKDEMQPFLNVPVSEQRQ